MQPEEVEARFTALFITMSPEEQKETLETLGDLAGMFVNVIPVK